MAKTRRDRTREAILRAVLNLITSGEKLSKARVHQTTPCSPATLFRFYPDLEVARVECFFGMAAQEIIQPYFNAMTTIADTNPTLAERLHAITRLQHAFVLSQLSFVREFTRISLDDPSLQGQKADETIAFCARLAQEALDGEATPVQQSRLAAQLQQIIGFQAMFNSYQVAQKAGIAFTEHCDSMTAALLDQVTSVK